MDQSSGPVQRSCFHGRPGDSSWETGIGERAEDCGILSVGRRTLASKGKLSCWEAVCPGLCRQPPSWEQQWAGRVLPLLAPRLHLWT